MSTGISEADLRYEIAEGARRWWWLSLVAGILWILISLVILRFDAKSVTAVGIIAGVVFLVAGVEELMTIGAVQGGLKWLHGVLGVILVAGGVVALVNPVDTFLALASLMGWILLFLGLFNIIVGLMNRDVELWWLRLVTGIIAIGLAVAVSGEFSHKAVVLVAFVGAFALVKGITSIVLAFQLRSFGKGTPRPA